MATVSKKLKLSDFLQIRDQIARVTTPSGTVEYHLVFNTAADEYTTVKLDENSKQAIDAARLSAVELLKGEVNLTGEPVSVRKKVTKVIPAQEVTEWVNE